MHVHAQWIPQDAVNWYVNWYKAFLCAAAEHILFPNLLIVQFMTTSPVSHTGNSHTTDSGDKTMSVLCLQSCCPQSTVNKCIFNCMRGKWKLAAARNQTQGPGLSCQCSNHQATITKDIIECCLLQELGERGEGRDGVEGVHSLWFWLTLFGGRRGGGGRVGVVICDAFCLKGIFSPNWLHNYLCDQS